MPAPHFNEFWHSRWSWKEYLVTGSRYGAADVGLGLICKMDDLTLICTPVERVLLFHIEDEGRIYKIYSDGWIEGFSDNVIFSNQLSLVVKQMVIAELDKQVKLKGDNAEDCYNKF